MGSNRASITLILLNLSIYKNLEINAIVSESALLTKSYRS